MCEHCGCRGVPPIAELMDEHMALTGQAHFVRQELGIFPVSVVTLGATGWAIVDEAHTASPSFLLDTA